MTSRWGERTKQVDIADFSAKPTDNVHARERRRRAPIAAKARPVDEEKLLVCPRIADNRPALCQIGRFQRWRTMLLAGSPGV